MGKKDDVTPESITVVQEDQTPTTPAAQPGTEAVDWEKRFKGMQGAYQQLKGKLDESELALATKQTELEALKMESKSSSSKIEDLTKQIEAEKLEAEKLQSNLANAKKDNEISKKVLTDYPELAKFWADGVIARADSTDEQIAIFEKFKTSLGTKVDQEIDQKVKGSSPIATGTQQKLSAEQVYQEMVVLAGSNDPKDIARYKQLQVLWDKHNE